MIDPNELMRLAKRLESSLDYEGDAPRREAVIEVSTALRTFAGEAAVGYVNTDGTVTWYTDDFGTISRKPKPGTDVYIRPLADPLLANEVIALADERELGYKNREHGGVLNHRIADKLVALANRLKGSADHG